MSAFGDYRADLVAKLVAAGITATGDPAARPPFVLVGLVTTTAAEGIGSWAATIPVTVAVPPPGDAAAGAALEQMTEAVYGVLGFAPARPTTYSPGGDRDTALPCYQLTYPASIPNPAC